MRVRSLGREDPLEEGMATHFSILAWRIPWTEEPGGLQSMGSQRVAHDWSGLACMQTRTREGVKKERNPVFVIVRDWSYVNDCSVFTYRECFPRMEYYGAERGTQNRARQLLPRGQEAWNNSIENRLPLMQTQAACSNWSGRKKPSTFMHHCSFTKRPPLWRSERAEQAV